MREQIEINEDNCVLDGQDLSIIDMVFKRFIEEKQNEGLRVNKIFTKFLQKITKLNDLVKYMQKRGILIYDGDDSLARYEEKNE